MYSSINFVRNSRHLPDISAVEPHSGIWLEWRNWNDFGWWIRFVAYVPTGKIWMRLGQVVLAYRDENGMVARNTWTALGGSGATAPPSVDSLDIDHFASMGTTLEYYEWFISRDEIEFLVHMSDINLPEFPKRQWEDQDVVKDGFLRGSSAQKVFAEVAGIFDRNRPDRMDLSFEFEMAIEEGEQPFRVVFTLNPLLDIPRRVNVVVGPNGSGKTSLIYRLAEDLSKLHAQGPPPASIVRPPNRVISRQVVVSNNPFDLRRRAQLAGLRSVDRVGLQYVVDDTLAEVPTDASTAAWQAWLLAQFPDQQSFRNQVSPALRAPNEDDLASLFDERQDWRKVLDGILTATDIDYLLEQPSLAFPELSAGQQSIVLILSGLAAHLDQESLVLLDEPEAHLHPWHVAQFSRALHLLLEERRCFAIIATHSAQFLRDVPSDCVNVIWRRSGPNGAHTISRALRIQSFGASETVLRREVFGVPPDIGYWAEQFLRLRSNTAGSDIAASISPPLEPEVQAMINVLVADEDEG